MQSEDVMHSTWSLFEHLAAFWTGAKSASLAFRLSEGDELRIDAACERYLFPHSFTRRIRAFSERKYAKSKFDSDDAGLLPHKL